MVHLDFLVLLNFNLDLTSSLILKLKYSNLMALQISRSLLIIMVLEHYLLLMDLVKFVGSILQQIQFYSKQVVLHLFYSRCYILVLDHYLVSDLLQKQEQFSHQKAQFYSFHLVQEQKTLLAHMKVQEQILFLELLKKHLQMHIKERVHSSVQEVRQKLQQFPKQKALFYSRLLAEKQMHSSDLLLLKVMLLSAIIWMRHSQDLMLAKVRSSDLMVLLKR